MAGRSGCSLRRRVFLRLGPGAAVDAERRARRIEPGSLTGLRLHRIDAAQGTGAAWRGMGAHAGRDIPLGRLYRCLEWPVARLCPRIRRCGPSFRCLGATALSQFLAAEVPACLSRSPDRLDAGPPDADSSDINRPMERRSRIMVVARFDTEPAVERYHQLCRQRWRRALRRGAGGLSRDAARAD